MRNGRVLVSVSDNGSGMSASFIENELFKPFSSTKNRGLGIGMFQSKMIVESHRGRISVQSKKGKGTTISISLPLPRAGRPGVELKLSA
jgi:signal transduction histidine kinase